MDCIQKISIRRSFHMAEEILYLRRISFTTRVPNLRGHIWQKFASQGFFDSKFNLALMLNVDWFRPFKRSEYKVAAITMTVLNLPREERYKKKWTIIAGIYICTIMDGHQYNKIEMNVKDKYTLHRIIIIIRYYSGTRRTSNSH